jgi:hypothetical protein
MLSRYSEEIVHRIVKQYVVSRSSRVTSEAGFSREHVYLPSERLCNHIPLQRKLSSFGGSQNRLIVGGLLYFNAI